MFDFTTQYSHPNGTREPGDEILEELEAAAVELELELFIHFPYYLKRNAQRLVLA